MALELLGACCYRRLPTPSASVESDTTNAQTYLGTMFLLPFRVTSW